MCTKAQQCGFGLIVIFIMNDGLQEAGAIQYILQALGALGIDGQSTKQSRASVWSGSTNYLWFAIL